MMRYAMTVLLLSLAVTADAQFEVPLSIRNHTDIAVRGAPVRGGIPFARGVLRDGFAFHLMSEAGEELSCQTRPIAHWYDGSIKWLLVDTQADIAARDEAKLTLSIAAANDTPSPSSRVAQGVTIQREGADIIVGTGAARFIFSGSEFGLPAAAWVDLDKDGEAETQMVNRPGEFVCEIQHQLDPPTEENWLREASDGPREIFSAGAGGDYKVEVESANDLRAVIKVSGWLVNKEGRRLIQYVIRAHACAGQAELRLCPTFIYAGEAKEDFIRAMYLRFPRMSEAETAWSFGGETKHDGTIRGADSVSLYETGPEKFYHLSPYTQDKTVTYAVVSGGKEIGKGKEAAGWARLSDGRGSMHLAMRNFWQMHPKELQLERDALKVYLWPEEGHKVLDLRRRYEGAEDTYHYDLEWWPYGGQGVGVTHEMLLRFGAPADDLGADMAAAVNAPLLLECAPQYYVDSGCFGPFAVADVEHFPRLEGLQNVIVEWIRHNQQAFHWDGMIDYGDTFFHGYATRTQYGYVAPQGWCSRGYVGWLNDDGTLTHSLFIQYLRTGDYPTFLTAANMARHSMDVDVCHYCAEEPRYVGGGHRHDQQHWGSDVKGYGAATQGIMDLYLLTGDERALDVARERAQYHDNGKGTEDQQQVGGLYRFWEISGEEHWRKRAAEILANDLNVPADANLRIRAAGRLQLDFRFISDASVSLTYYLHAAAPDETAALRTAIVKTMDNYYERFVSRLDDENWPPVLLCAQAYHITGDRKYAIAAAALLQRRASGRREPPPGFLRELRALGFEDMLTKAKEWSVNNIYLSTVWQLNPIPYCMAVFQEAGMDEQAALDPSLRTMPDMPAFEEILSPRRMRASATQQGKNTYMFEYRMEHLAPDDKEPGGTRIILFEDGKPLGPAHSSHESIRTLGMGRWSHWGAQDIQFSTSDNSDPRTNGKEYKVIYPGSRKE